MVLQSFRGTIETVIVVHHTGKPISFHDSMLPGNLTRKLDCGLTHKSDEDVRAHLRTVVPSGTLESGKIDDMAFGEIKEFVYRS